MGNRIYFCFLLMIMISSAAFAQQQQQRKPAKGQFLPATLPLTSSTKMHTKEADILLYVKDFSSGRGEWLARGEWTATAGFMMASGNNADDWLIGPEIALPRDAKKLILSLREKVSLESGHDFGRVKVSRDGGQTWIQVAQSSGVSDWRESYVDITSFRGDTVMIGFQHFSDPTNAGEGWLVEQVSLIEPTVETGLNIQVQSLSAQNFPLVYMNIMAESPGDPSLVLDQSAFSVFENGIRQVDLFEVTPPVSGGGQRLADIIFCVDVTGSMSDEIAAVKNNMLSFVNALIDSDINFNIGFVTFGDIVYAYNNHNMYSNPETILSVVNNIRLGEHGIGDGGDNPENPLGAMAEGAKFNFRPGAQRVQIMITDATAHEANAVTPWTVQSLIDNLLVPNNMLVFPVFDTRNSQQKDQYIPLAVATNPKGTYFNVYDNFNQILDEIGAFIANTYLIRYRSSNPYCDGVLRNVSVHASHGAEEASDQASYMPCESPVIERTPETIALHDQAWAENSLLSFSVKVTDNFEPFINQVKIFYKRTGAVDYQSTTMTYAGDNIWSISLPPGAVLAPGLDYYFTGTDGIHTVSDPPLNPAAKPFQLAVLPNVAPYIVHDPVECLTIGEDIAVTAAIFDETNFVSEVNLYYRRPGQLIYQEQPMMLVSGVAYAGTIPGAFAVTEGTEYYISVWDNFGVRTDHGSPSKPHLIPVCDDGHEIPTGGIYLEIVETHPTKRLVASAGYEYSYKKNWRSLRTRETKAVEVTRIAGRDAATVFLPPPEFPDGVISQTDFEDQILLFDASGTQVGHIGFSYSFEWESMRSRHAIVFLHTDDEICKSPGLADYFPYSKDNPNNLSLLGRKMKYKYYNDGEYPVSMLIPPNLVAGAGQPAGYRIPGTSERNRQPVVFVAGLRGTFSYQKNLAMPELTAYKNEDQVSYWFDTERRLTQGGIFHGWQFYYPNEDDLRHCGLMLKNAANFVHGFYSKPVHFVAHSMGGVVTMEFLTGPGNYHPSRTGKVVLSQSPIHGSLAANRNYGTILSPLTQLAKWDGYAPAYRDLSIGSDFLYALHDRDWPAGLVNNTFVFMGLTMKNFKTFGYLFQDFHKEAIKHTDGIVSYSNASLLNRGIGFLAFYGHHDDGKYSKSIRVKNFLAPLISAYFSDVSGSAGLLRAEATKAGSPVEVFVNGRGEVLKPAGTASINDLTLGWSDVNFQKGGITLVTSDISSSELFLYKRARFSGTDYIITSELIPILKPHFSLMGRFIKNKHASIHGGGAAYYFTKGFYISGITSLTSHWGNTGFDFLSGTRSITYASSFGISSSHFANLTERVTEHQFVKQTGKSLFLDGEPTESTPIKEIIAVQGGVVPLKEFFVDDQTSRVDFFLYSETLEYYEADFSMIVKDPDGNELGPESPDVYHQVDPLTGANLLSVPDPMPGEWFVQPVFDMPGLPEVVFSGKGMLVSEIRMHNLTKEVFEGAQRLVEVSAAIEGPGKHLFIRESLHASARIVSLDGSVSHIPLDHIEETSEGYTFRGEFIAEQDGYFSYSIVLEGIYNDYRFERAVFGQFSVTGVETAFFIPDLELSHRNSYTEIYLTDYLFCSYCEEEKIAFNVVLNSSSFYEDAFYFGYSASAGTLQIEVDQTASPGLAEFEIQCYHDGQFIASDIFFVKFNASGVPVGLMVSDIDLDSAELTWVPGGLEAGWEIIYGPAGFDPDKGGSIVEGVADPYYTLTALIRSTAYDVYVRAVQEDGGFSAWSWPVSFTTNHQVSIITGENGHASPEVNQSVGDGYGLVITISPDEGFRVAGLTINGTWVNLGQDPMWDSLAGQYTLSGVSESQVVEIHFEPDTYTIMASATGSGTLDPSGKVVVSNGENMSFRIEPASGYHIAAALVNGLEIDLTGDPGWDPDAGEYTFYQVENDFVLEVVFSINIYLIEAYPSPQPGGQVSGTGTYEHGTEVILTAMPVQGFHFYRWTENGEWLMNEKSTLRFEAKQNRNLVVHFVDRNFILLSDYLIGATANASFREVTVTADKPWVASPAVSWLSVYPNHGPAGTSLATVSWLPNPGANERIGDLEFRSESTTTTLRLQQESNVVSVVEPGEAGIGILIFPNPVRNILTVDLLPENAVIRLVDLQGKVLHFDENPGQQSRIDLSGATPGLLSLVIILENQVLVHKVLKL